MKCQILLSEFVCLNHLMVFQSRFYVKQSYIVSYNKDTKLPNWVAWNLTSDHTDGPYRRLGNFYEDEEAPHQASYT